MYNIQTQALQGTTAAMQDTRYLEERFGSGEIQKRPSERIRNLRKELKQYRFSIDTERALLMTRADRLYSNKSRIVRCAMTLAHILENISITITQCELIVGHAGARPKHGPIFPEFSMIQLSKPLQDDIIGRTELSFE